MITRVLYYTAVAIGIWRSVSTAIKEAKVKK